MSQPENQMGQNAPAYPEYGAPVVQPQQAAPEEPARLNWLQRLTGLIFSPGEVFADINRKPTILIPLILSVVVVAGVFYFTFWRVNPDWEKVTRDQMKVAEKFGAKIPEDQMAEAIESTRNGAKFTPLYIGASQIVKSLIVAGVLVVGMIMLQAKTTFKKIFSVVLWSSAVNWLVYAIVFIAAFMVKNQEALQSVDINNPFAAVPTNPAPFIEAKGVLQALATSFDVFMFWMIALLAIGLAAIAGNKRVTLGKTATLTIALWVVVVLISLGFARMLTV